MSEYYLFADFLQWISLVEGKAMKNREQENVGQYLHNTEAGKVRDNLLILGKHYLYTSGKSFKFFLL